MSEQWRQVEGWPYEVSNFGRVRRVTDECGTRAGRMVRPSEYGRYAIVTLRNAPRKQCVHIHILVCRAFLGDCPHGYEVNHKDGVKRNNRVDNLEYVTKKENGQHASRTGLLHMGDHHYAARLTGKMVREARGLARSGWTHLALANRFNVAKSTIGHAIRGKKNWKHLGWAEC